MVGVDFQTDVFLEGELQGTVEKKRLAQLDFNPMWFIVSISLDVDELRYEIFVYKDKEPTPLLRKEANISETDLEKHFVRVEAKLCLSTHPYRAAGNEHRDLVLAIMHENTRILLISCSATRGTESIPKKRARKRKRDEYTECSELLVSTFAFNVPPPDIAYSNRMIFSPGPMNYP